MATSKETPDEILLRAGASAAAQARAIAAKLAAGQRDPSWIDFVVNPVGGTVYVGQRAGALVSQATRDAVHAIHDLNPFGAVSDTVNRAADTADTVVNAIKWVGIVALVVVGALIALWLIVLLTGAKWAITILAPIAPQIARAAARGAVGA